MRVNALDNALDVPVRVTREGPWSTRQEYAEELRRLALRLEEYDKLIAHACEAVRTDHAELTAALGVGAPQDRLRNILAKLCSQYHTRTSELKGHKFSR
jgi:hypothetical protein